MLCYSWFSWALVPFGRTNTRTSSKQHNRCFARDPVPFGNATVATVALSHVNSHLLLCNRPCRGDLLFSLGRISWASFQQTDAQTRISVYECVTSIYTWGNIADVDDSYEYLGRPRADWNHKKALTKWAMTKYLKRVRGGPEGPAEQ